MDAFKGSRAEERKKAAESILAQVQRVTIIPVVEIERIELIEGVIGPFFPMVPGSVPLYAAVLLKESMACSIHPPNWLSISYLKRAIEREEELIDEFSSIEMYLFDNAYICLEHCAVIEDTSEIRVLLKQLEEIRINKLLKGIEYIDTFLIGTNNLTFHEFRRIKEYLLPHMTTQRAIT
ncbi:GINS complex subunit 2 [Nematocida sp. LUAm3]|nr:GINS complex subunit 2 [Nematocida sp. LUAm3]KAI5175151.1 GINS complex subunit 2 [Nematocida sp. LUAm2]KAI5178177.1 GINS complex subunit 2 [Nematocida sp. LUAm1]